MDNYYFQKNFTAVVYLEGMEDEIGDKAITTYDPNQIKVELVDFNCLCFNLYRIIGKFYTYSVEELHQRLWKPEDLYNRKYKLAIYKGNELVFEEKPVKKEDGYYIQVFTCRDNYVKDTLNRELFRDNPNKSNINRIWLGAI